MRAVETSTVLFTWVIFAHPTPDEQGRLYDSMGPSTDIAWRVSGFLTPDRTERR